MGLSETETMVKTTWQIRVLSQSHHSELERKKINNNSLFKYPLLIIFPSKRRA